MAIYDLNQAYYLWEDIDETLNTIGLLHSIEQNKGKRFIKSKTKVSGEFHFTSEECQPCLHISKNTIHPPHFSPLKENKKVERNSNA